MEYNKKRVLKFRIAFFILLEVALFVFVLSFFNFSLVKGDVGENVSVATSLIVGNVFPEVLNVSLDNNSATVTLVANTTQLVSCVGIVRDYNNDSDFNVARAEFYDLYGGVLYGGADDNNTHYTNGSCNITTNFTSWNEVIDDDYLALVNCNFSVWYYANASIWNCTLFINDTQGWSATGNDSITIDSLLAIGVPSTINYGTVNATYVSNENLTNVTNVGNVKINLSLSGYGVDEGDGLAMNCTLGSNGTIPIDYEKYNLTATTSGDLTLTQFEGNYTNLTSAVVVNNMDLFVRQNDAAQGTDDTNATYWRIYVPLGVAGTCNGTIIFGATTAVA